MNDQQFELQKMLPYKKTLRPGDIFALKFGDSFYLHGRVIRTDAHWNSAKEDGGKVNLVYVYDTVASTADGYDLSVMTPDRLLVRPVLINNLGWSRGFMSTVANSPLQSADVLDRHIFEHRGAHTDYYNEYFDKVALDGWTGPVGQAALSSYASLGHGLSAALANRGIQPPAS